jgi:hypothetical protein
VILSAVMFGLQHLSLFATGSSSTEDVVTIVALTAAYGYALAAFQFRFAWILPLILAHAASDFTQILTTEPVPFAMHVLIALAFLAYGIWLLKGRKEAPTGAPLIRPR